MTPTKVVSDGYVYARSLSATGEVLEKVDPELTHDAPASVAIGATVVVHFGMRDFDGEQRTDSGGTLLLNIDGNEVALPITNGSAELELELHASIQIEQVPPYFCDARMAPFIVEVDS